MARRILRQKLLPPPPWEGAIARPRLMTALDAAIAEGAHVGLFAGTGYGKTALLADWSRSLSHGDEPRALAWLSLDAEDADLDVFLAYLVASCERVLPDFRTEASGLLGRAREREGAFAALAALLADLDEQCDRPFLLVIDDYHLAASPTLDAMVARLLRYLPPAVRLVLASRKPPDAELALAQAHRLLRIVDEPALAFDRDELRTLRPEQDGDTLLAATGGWPAAMGMTPELMDAFLDEQLLANLDAGLQQFLLRLAVVDGFDAELCEEALGEPLTRERRTRLLEERLVYQHGRDRYVMHPALRNLLARRFQAEVGREERRALLRRVGDYYWRGHQSSTALRFWSDAGEAVWAAERLIPVAGEWLADGRLDALASAIGGLGAEAERPELLTLQGELHRRWGDFARAEELFERAAGAADAGGRPELAARARLGLAQAAASRGNVAGARARLEQVGKTLGGDRRFQVDLLILEGGLALLEGRTEGAIARFEQALELGRELADAYAEARATHNMGICFIRMGEFERALACYDRAVAATAADQTPLVWMAPINRALVLLHLGQLPEAAEAADGALSLVRRYKLSREEGYALRILGFARLRLGDLAAARAGFEASELLARRVNDRLGLAYSLNFRAELALATGEVEAALALVDEAEAAMGGNALLEFGQVRVRALFMAGREAEARPLLEGLLAEARAKGYVQVLRETEQLAAGLPPAPAPVVAPPTAAFQLRIRCFGGLRVTRPDGEVSDREWQTARAKQLLAFFLFHPEGASKTHLLDAVFPGEEVSNDLMNMTLMRLRKALEPTLEKGQPSRFILRADGRYAFNRQARVALDTEAFEAALGGGRADLERALELYRGDFLPELNAPWAVAMRHHLQERALEACRRLLVIYDEEAPGLVAELLKRALAIDPLSEEFNRELILRYLEADDHRQALRHYELCEHRYRELLNAEPPEDLGALVLRGRTS